jgi:site-specific DNA-cytosine methylase
MELFNPVDLIISGWECQGFLTAGFGKGLNATRSSLFMDMVRLITWAQSISFMLGYVIENTPFQLDQKRKSKSTTHWSNITLESRSYSMRHNAIPMRTSCITSGPTLHHSQIYN